jgi:hypothetical protein
MMTRLLKELRNDIHEDTKESILLPLHDLVIVCV